MSGLEVLIRRLPDSEHEAARILARHLEELYRYARRFAAAVALFDLADAELFKPDQSSDTMREWSFIVGRDGAMTIFHFGMVLKAINDQLPKCPSVFQHASRQKLGDANDLYKKALPAADKIRHAVGHEAELRLTRKQVTEHELSGPRHDALVSADHVEGFMTGNFENRFYSVTFKGEILRYELSASTAAILSTIANLMADAISEACLVERP
jgi:hypothetical protein